MVGFSFLFDPVSKPFFLSFQNGAYCIIVHKFVELLDLTKNRNKFTSSYTCKMHLLLLKEFPYHGFELNLKFAGFLQNLLFSTRLLSTRISETISCNCKCLRILGCFGWSGKCRIFLGKLTDLVNKHREDSSQINNLPSLSFVRMFPYRKSSLYSCCKMFHWRTLKFQLSDQFWYRKWISFQTASS